MAAASVKEPFDSLDWIFETKLDGYRAIAVIDSTGKARLWSRNHLPLEPKFPTIQDAVSQLKLRSTILDGEIVALDKDGVPRFQLLQQWQKRPTAPVVLYLFDLLWSDGRNITGKTVLQRRDRLEQIVNPVPGIQVDSYVENRLLTIHSSRNLWDKMIGIGSCSDRLGSDDHRPLKGNTGRGRFALNASTEAGNASFTSSESNRGRAMSNIASSAAVTPPVAQMRRSAL